MQATFGGAGSGVGPNMLVFQYKYAYTPAGKVSSKTLEVQSYNHLLMGGGYAYGAVTASYAYDSQGVLTSLTYPQCGTWVICGSQTTLNYTLDAMERPTGMTDQTNHTWASGATYNAASQPLHDGTATRTYNNLLQMTSITGSGMTMTYNYSSTQNNGQITSSVDAVTGETITYQYDALKRLLTASGKNWGETYTYDGYGNLTHMQPTGTGGAPTLNVSVALDANNVPTNRINGGGAMYDNNGNQTGGFALQMIYDLANRVSAVGNTYFSHYAYDSDNRRIYYLNTSGNETIYFYGADGTKLATYTYTIVHNGQTGGNLEIQLTQQSTNVYFLGKLISAEGNSVQTDRLGSVRSGGPGGLGHQAQFPYGAEYTPTANDREKYATYTRDSATGLDYAMNRYYSSQWGRFLSPDPYAASVRLADPGGWNRYAYTRNDPANRLDQSGLVDNPPEYAGPAILAPDPEEDDDEPILGPTYFGPMPTAPALLLFFSPVQNAKERAALKARIKKLGNCTKILAGVSASDFLAVANKQITSSTLTARLALPGRAAARTPYPETASAQPWPPQSSTMWPTHF
jgi:RHS repeat-associated protein